MDGSNSLVELSVANHWADFKRKSGRRTTNNSQNHFFEDDNSFEFAPQSDDKLIWGNVRLPSSYAHFSSGVAMAVLDARPDPIAGSR